MTDFKDQIAAWRKYLDWEPDDSTNDALREACDLLEVFETRLKAAEVVCEEAQKKTNDAVSYWAIELRDALNKWNALKKG